MEHLTEEQDDGIPTAWRPPERDHLHSRWEEIQTGFVDEPQDSVRRANALVAEVKGRLTERVVEEQMKVRARCDPVEATSTEELRAALIHCRALFLRLLSASDALETTRPERNRELSVSGFAGRSSEEAAR